MGAVVNRVTFDATGSHKIANAGEGMSDAGWQISVVGHSWTGSALLKQGTNAPGSPVTVGSALTYYTVTSGAASSAAITSATSVIVQDTGSDLYFDYTHTSGTVTVTVSAAGQLQGADEGILPVLNPAFTGTMTGPAITLSGAFSAASYGAMSATTGVFVSSSASALAVGPTGTTNPALVVDASAGASVLAGLKVTAATSAGTVAVAVQSPGTNASLSLAGKGNGTITLGSVVLSSAGAISSVTTIAATGQISVTGTGGGRSFYHNAAGSVAQVNINLTNSGGNLIFGVESSAGGSLITGTAAYRGAIESPAGIAISGNDGNNVHVLLASSGAISFAAGVTASSTLGVTGAATFSSSVLSNSALAGIGYATGAGGSSSQQTNKSTAVTVNAVCGQITMNAAALDSHTTVAFTLNNTAIAANDHVQVQHFSGGTLGAYNVCASSVANSATISVRNVTNGSLSEAVVLQYFVFKSVVA